MLIAPGLEFPGEPGLLYPIHPVNGCLGGILDTLPVIQVMSEPLPKALYRVFCDCWYCRALYFEPGTVVHIAILEYQTP